MKLRKYKTFYYNGQIEREAYWLSGKRHNPDGPAYRSWYDNGQIEAEVYYLNYKLHNPNGPAIKKWSDNGQLIREEYWLNGEWLTKKEFDNLKTKK